MKIKRMAKTIRRVDTKTFYSLGNHNYSKSSKLLPTLMFLLLASFYPLFWTLTTWLKSPGVGGGGGGERGEDES